VRIRLLLTALSVLAVAGCTTTSEGTPLPDSNATTESPSEEPSTPDAELPTDGAPKVENPLDVSHFEQNPCDALTAEQTQELNVPATGDERDSGFGKTCYWRNSETRGVIGLSFFSEVEGGLSSLYREAESSDFPYFKSIEDIEGYPAVAYDTEVEEPTITCTVAVGVADKLAFAVQVDLSDANVGQKEPCGVTKQVASMIMKTMREAA
jgi:hypothetical protein